MKEVNIYRFNKDLCISYINKFVFIARSVIFAALISLTIFVNATKFLFNYGSKN